MEIPNETDNILREVIELKRGKESVALSPEIKQIVEVESQRVVDIVAGELQEFSGSSGMIFMPQNESLTNKLTRKGRLLNKKLDEMTVKFAQKNTLFVLNLIPGVSELIRDLEHDAPKVMMKAKPVPLATEGVAGFVDQHIGDIWETIVLFHVISTGMDVGSSVSKRLIGKELSDDQKFALSIIGAGLGTYALELNTRNADPLDAFGIAVGLLYMTAAYKTIQRWPEIGPRIASSLEKVTSKVALRVDEAMSGTKSASGETSE